MRPQRWGLLREGNKEPPTKNFSKFDPDLLYHLLPQKIFQNLTPFFYHLTNNSKIFLDKTRISHYYRI